MNGPEHYREAEQCINDAGNADRYADPADVAMMLRFAQVHATLALVAATIDQIGARGPGDITGDWAQVLS